MAYKKNTESRPYQAPEIRVNEGFTYNKWDALAIVHGVNAPFVSKIAKDVRDDEGFFLWSSPRLVLTVAEASHAFQSGNEDRNRDMLAAAIHFCNEFLPADSQLPENTILKLTWAQYGIAAITCEERRNSPGEFMDIVRHGVNTVILNGAVGTEMNNLRMATDQIFTPTGLRFERSDKPRNSASPKRSGYGGRNNWRGANIGA